MRLGILCISLFFILCLVSSPLQLSNAPDSIRINPDSIMTSLSYKYTLPKRKAALKSYFEKAYAQKRFHGVVIITEKDKILHQGAYGYANLSRKDTLSMESSFQLASVSKIFTAVAIMILYEDCKLDFEDKVQQHLPDFPYEKLKIKHLLNHRSGLGRYMAISGKYWKKRWREPLSNKEVYRQYSKYKPVTYFNPGNGFNYCNTNYVFLASIVEEISGLSFGEFCRQRIFEPLGMDQSVIKPWGSEVEVPNEVVGYKRRWRGWRKAANDYIDGVVGDKGMYASVQDLYKFDQALNKHVILQPSTIEQAFSPGSPVRFNNYGFGWRLKAGKEVLPYHFGWWRGFRSAYIHDYEHDRTVIMLCNKDISGLNRRFWDIYDFISSGRADGV